MAKKSEHQHKNTRQARGRGEESGRNLSNRHKELADKSAAELAGRALRSDREIRESSRRFSEALKRLAKR
jgi:hypothetical protein